LRSVVNDAIKAAARQARHRSLDEETSTSGEDGAADAALLAELLADPGPGPEALAETAETRQAVWRALGQLPPAERGAIVRRYYLDQGEREMAAELNAPPGTIKWRLHRARERLRTWLSPALAEAPSERAGGNR
jgi:RNA polymerase sigma-70 factor (ECF subfamily)